MQFFSYICNYYGIRIACAITFGLKGCGEIIKDGLISCSKSIADREVIETYRGDKITIKSDGRYTAAIVKNGYVETKIITIYEKILLNFFTWSSNITVQLGFDAQYEYYVEFESVNLEIYRNESGSASATITFPELKIRTPITYSGFYEKILKKDITFSQKEWEKNETNIFGLVANAKKNY